MYVLAIDTSSPAVTAGIVSITESSITEQSITEPLVDRAAPEVVLAAERAPLAARGHGELLAPCIGDCLHDVGIAANELAAVVVGTGPGPFTGLRVGLVTAAAFADAAGIPLYGVCSLDALGRACAEDAQLLVATDARRHEVYWARYASGRRVTDPAVGRPADVPLDDVRAVAGAAGELYADVWPGLDRRAERYPDPVALVSLALDRIQSGAASESPVPLYLRRPDAVVPGRPKTVTA